MGNYSTLYGYIRIQQGKIEEFRQRYNKELNEYPNFCRMFLEENEEHMIGAKLSFNPKCNDFKVLGYPDYLNHFLGFFKNNLDVIDYFRIIADVEDASFFIFTGGLDYDNRNKCELQMFRTDDGIIESSQYKKWHQDFLDELSETSKDVKE